MWPGVTIPDARWGESRGRPVTASATHSAVACGMGFWPTTATGAVSQRPTQGACSTRTPAPSRAGSFASNSREPARSQAIESQTRTVIGGRRSLALFDHVEVVVERRHLVDLRHRHLHLVRKRDQMRRGQAAVMVLNLVQVLDQEIAAARRIAKQGQDILARLRVDSPAFRCRAYTAAAATPASFSRPVQA